MAGKPINFSHRKSDAENVDFNAIDRLVLSFGHKLSGGGKSSVGGKTFGFEIVLWVSSGGKFLCWAVKLNGKMKKLLVY